MDDCNPLAAISSFSDSTGNIRSDNHNVLVCMHEIESLSQHQCRYRRARNNDATPKNPRNNTTRSAACPDISDRHDGISNNQSDEDETNNDSDDSTETTKAQSVRSVNFNGIKIVHWNCRGANGKLAAIKDVIQRDCIDILLLQDTRLSRRRVDNLPKLRLHGYSTFDVSKSETPHGMVILVHKDIPSDLAQQFIFGPQTESLTIRIWIRGTSYLIHNIYNNGTTVNLSAAPSNERSMFLGDFNAHHASWCRARQNRAGINISDQLDDIDEYVMMNMESTEYVATTTYDTTIDLSIVHRDIAAKANWSIYDGMSSDHFPVMITWYVEPSPTIDPIPKFQMRKADWVKFEKIINSQLIGFHREDGLDEFSLQLSGILISAAEESIPKSAPSSKSVKMYWRHDLGVRCAKQDYNSANRKFRRNRTDANKRLMIEKFDIYKEMCKFVQEKSWRDWIEECNSELDASELWLRLRLSTGVATRSPTHPNPADKAEQLCQQFVMRSDSANLTVDARRTLKNLEPHREAFVSHAIRSERITDRPFNISELENALRRKKDTAPGEDGCTYSMIRQSPVEFKLLFLDLCNQSLHHGRLPNKWKVAQLIPIPKKDGTYRPISLITVMSKVCEKMVLNRLHWNAQPVNMFSLGFRSKVGTQDAVATVISHISKADAFKKKHSAALVLIDIEKAFEMASPIVVLQVLANAGIGGKMLAWLRDFLADRSGTVKFQNACSTTKNFHNGTPQGSCLSPTLFSYVINHLLNLRFPPTVQLVAYADDLALSCVHYDKDKVIRDIQSALDLLHTEAVNIGLKFSPVKTKALWFYTMQPVPSITLHGQILPWSRSERYLGIELDRNMTLTQQANSVAAKSKRNMNAMKVLSSLTSISGHILKRVYCACVQSTLEYGAIVTPLMCKTNIKTLQKIQNQGMRLILGVPKWTCINSMNQELGILPVRVRYEIAVAKFIDKVRFMESHPLHVSCSRPVMIRQERSKWLLKCKDIYNKLSPRGDDRTLEIFEEHAPWETPKIIYYVNRTMNKNKHSSEILRKAAESDMKDLPTGTHYYTDGSKSESRVAAAYIVNKQAAYFRLNNDATITQAELFGIWAAIEHAVINKLRPIIHTDSLTAIQLLRDNNKSERSLCYAILATSQYLEERPVLNWIPSHVGIQGNELADAYAKEGLKKDTIDHYVKSSHNKAQNSIGTAAMDIHHAIIQDCGTQTFRFNNKLAHTQQKYILQLPRHQQQMIYKIRLSSKTYAQIKGDHEKCPHCEEIFENRSKHWCVDCPAMVFQRERMLVYLTSEQAELRDIELVAAIINSQNNRKYHELLLMLKKFPF